MTDKPSIDVVCEHCGFTREAHPVSYCLVYQEPSITTIIKPERSTAMSPVLAAPYKGGAGLDFDDLTKRMRDAMPIMALVDAYLKTRPARLEEITTETLDASPFLLRNMVEENGRTIKQNNMDRNHTIPLDTLVELENGVRMFVVLYTRDCDGTPMYGLADYKQEEYINGNGQISTGHVEDSLRVVHQPTKLPPVQLKRWASAEAIVADLWGIAVSDIADSVATVAPVMDDGKLVMERDVPLSEWLGCVRGMGIWGFADTNNGVINYWIDATAPVTMEKMVEFFAHELYHLTFHPYHRSGDEAVEATCELEAGLAGELAAAAYGLVKDAVLTHHVVKES